MDFLFNAMGVAGALVILAAYFLLQYGAVPGNGFVYPFMNLLGALALIVSLLKFWNGSVFVEECIWALISLYGIMRHNARIGANGGRPL